MSQKAKSVPPEVDGAQQSRLPLGMVARLDRLGSVLLHVDVLIDGRPL